MLCKKTFSSRLRNFFNDHGDTREFLPYAIGKRLAYLLPVSDSFETIRETYKYRYDYQVSSIISDMNERFYFDTKEAQKTTYVVWNTRCQLVYNPNCIDFISLLCSSKVGLVSPDTIKRLEVLREKIVKLDSKAVDVLENIMVEEIQND